MNKAKEKIKDLLRKADSVYSRAAAKINSAFTNYTPANRPINIKRKILVDCTYLYSTNINTGIQRVIRNTIKGMQKSSDKKNIEIVPVALVNGAFIEIDKEKIIDFKRKNTSMAILTRVFRKTELFYKSFAQKVTIYRGDTVMMLDSSWYLPVWPSLDYAKKRGASIVGVAYDLIPISHPQFCDDRLQKVFNDWYRDSLPYFDGYISISKTVMKDLKKYLSSQEAPTDKYIFDYFHLGSNFTQGSIRDLNIREELKEIYSSGLSVYLTVSTIEPRKNHRYIFETFKKLWSHNIDAIWLIAGRKGWKVDSFYQDLYNCEKMGKNLYHFENLSDSELNYCYSHSKALIYASVVEGYGLPLIESLSCALPVLASDTEVHREVCGDMVEYFDTDKADALLDILKNIENGKKELKIPNSDAIEIKNWIESSEELMEKTILIADRVNLRREI